MFVESMGTNYVIVQWEIRTAIMKPDASDHERTL